MCVLHMCVLHMCVLHACVLQYGTRCKLGSKFLTVLVSLSGVGVVVELEVLPPLAMRPGQSSYRLLALD